MDSKPRGAGNRLERALTDHGTTTVLVKGNVSQLIMPMKGFFLYGYSLTTDRSRPGCCWLTINVVDKPNIPSWIELIDEQRDPDGNEERAGERPQKAAANGPNDPSGRRR